MIRSRHIWEESVNFKLYDILWHCMKIWQIKIKSSRMNAWKCPMLPAKQAQMRCNDPNDIYLEMHGETSHDPGSLPALCYSNSKLHFLHGTELLWRCWHCSHILPILQKVLCIELHNLCLFHDCGEMLVKLESEFGIFRHLFFTRRNWIEGKRRNLLRK